jgi:predicted acetyltransferase
MGLSQTDLHRYGALVANAFAFPPAEAPAWFAYAGQENIRVQREDGEIVGGLILIHQGQFWGGRAVRMGGVAGVATAPHARGRGAATRMMQSALRELRSMGYPLSGLYPATQGLYRRVGFEQAGARAEVRGWVRDLPRGDRELPVRPFKGGDEDAVADLYSALARKRNGWLDRGLYAWTRVQNPRGLLAHGFVFGEGSEPEGYLFVAKVRGPGSTYDLKIPDLQFRTERAARRILTFLADDASMAGEFSWFTAADHPLLLLLREQKMSVAIQDSNYWMLRVLDVPAALQARGWPRGLRGELQLEIEDDLFEDNSGRWVLTVSGGEGSVRRGGEGHLRCHVRGLSSGDPPPSGSTARRAPGSARGRSGGQGTRCRPRRSRPVRPA